jgi:hypothetical protein
MNEMDDKLFEISSENLPLLINKKKKNDRIKFKSNKSLNIKKDIKRPNKKYLTSTELPNVSNNKYNKYIQKINLPDPLQSKNSSLNTLSFDIKDSLLSETSFLNKSDNLNPKDFIKNIIFKEEEYSKFFNRNKSFYHLLIQEWTITLFTLFSIISAIFFHSTNISSKLKDNNKKLFNICINFNLIICSISSFFFSIIFLFNLF